MVLSHFVAQDSDTSLPILLNMTAFLQAEQKEEEEEEEVCLPDRQLSRGGRKARLRSRFCLQTYKNNCFHVPESLAAPSDRGRMMEGCTARGWEGGGELAGGNPREEIREQYRSS